MKNRILDAEEIKRLDPLLERTLFRAFRYWGMERDAMFRYCHY